MAQVLLLPESFSVTSQSIMCSFSGFLQFSVSDEAVHTAFGLIHLVYTLNWLLDGCILVKCRGWTNCVLCLHVGFSGFSQFSVVSEVVLFI